MGMFEQFLGNYLVPIMLLVLALLAYGKGRRVLNKIVLGTANVHLTVGGYTIKFFPMLAFVNMFYFMVLTKKI